MSIESLVKENIKSLKSYEIPDISCPIKLDAMENPYDLPEEIKELVREKISGFNRYPDPLSNELRKTIASYLGMNKEEILVGNGSDELILNILLTFKSNRVVFPTPTFAMYKILAQIANSNPVGIPLTDEFELDDEGILKATADATSIIFLAYPNNPTGNCFSKEKMLRIVEESEGLIIIDEAYFEFSKETFLSVIDSYPKVIILRTFSKAFGLAGLRCGYLVAHPELVKALLKVKLPYNLNSFSQIVAGCVMENFRYLLQPQINQIITQRERLYLFLKRLNGIIPYPSDANFILFKTTKVSANTIFSDLVEEGVLIRNLTEDIPNCLRVTVGSEQENNIFMEKLDRICRRY
ncbi:MAG: histidinol-phosphate transaminase [bacterium]|nr:histidinol-phosphate transaminase [bacterium]